MHNKNLPEDGSIGGEEQFVPSAGLPSAPGPCEDGAGITAASVPCLFAGSVKDGCAPHAASVSSGTPSLQTAGISLSSPGAFERLAAT